jgi:uncharacterized protein (UPF0335 family)
MNNLEKQELLEKEIESLRVEIDEIWKALTSLSLDMAANKINIDIVCRELIKKEKVL